MFRASVLSSILVAACALGPNLKKLRSEKTYQNSSTVQIAVGDDHAFKLQYLTLRSLADLPVAMLEYSEASYIATYYGADEFKKEVKHNLNLGRLPVLNHHGLKLSQSSTIVRYLAGELGLDGDNHRERSKIDMIYETIKELFGTHTNIKFNASALSNITYLHEFLAAEEEPVPHYRDTTNKGEYSEIMKSAVILKTFNDMLDENEGHHKYLVGHQASYADIALFLELEKAHEAAIHDMPVVLSALGLQSLIEHYLEFLSHMHLSMYLSSDRRMPRYKKSAEGVYQYIFPETPDENDDPEEGETQTDSENENHAEL